MQYKLFFNYLRTTAWLIFVCLLFVVAFNRFMDPFDIFDGLRIEGINAKKPAFFTHLRLSKAFAVYKFKPTAIILGSSRSEIGIDPQHPGWGNQHVYNLGLANVNIYEVLRYLQHAQAIHPLKQVILMLDFFMFDSANNNNQQDFNEHRLSVSLDGVLQNQGRDIFSAVASLDALSNSIDTFFKQDMISDYHPNGMQKPTKMQSVIKKYNGYRSTFKTNESNFFNKAYQDFTIKTPDQNNWEVYQQIISFAYKQGIDLRMAISPSHARRFELIGAMGNWDIFEQWKHQLLQISEEEAAKLSKPPFPIWDFSGFNYYTTEEVPRLSDSNAKMQWYWESSHFKKELGDLVLDRIFDHQEPERTIDPCFGTLMTLENIEHHLQQIRSDRHNWRISFPDDVLEIENLLTLNENLKTS